MLTASNDNRATSAGCSYYPEMGQVAPRQAIIHADLSHYGRHYYLTFNEDHRDQVLDLLRASKVRYTSMDEAIGDANTVRVTCAAFDRFRKQHRDLCTMRLLLD